MPKRIFQTVGIKKEKKEFNHLYKPEMLQTMIQQFHKNKTIATNFGKKKLSQFEKTRQHNQLETPLNKNSFFKQRRNKSLSAVHSPE